VNTHWTERLSEYVDDELTPAERAECEAHLATCGPCRIAADELKMVVEAARADRDRMPTADLWPGVLARIAPQDATGHSGGAPWRAQSAVGGPWAAPAKPRKQIVFTLPQLALAASLLIAVSAGVAYVAAGRVTPPALEDPIQAQAESLLPASATVERANFADVQFDQAVADLEKVLTERRDDLDPRTVLIIERNLAAIDQAIREAREALDADPANTFLNSHLADARRKKLELLRQATMLSSSGD
jgi:Putative zinc-finger